MKIAHFFKIMLPVIFIFSITKIQNLINKPLLNVKKLQQQKKDVSLNTCLNKRTYL